MKRIISLIFCLLPLLATKGQLFVKYGEIGEFKDASSFYINPQGDVFVADRGTNEVVKIDTFGVLKKRIGGYGWGQNSFDDPSGVFATALRVYVADRNNNRVEILDKDLNFVIELNSANYDNREISFAYPTFAATSTLGDIYILDSDNSRIIKYTSDGSFLTVIGGNDAGSYALSHPKDFAISADGNIYVANGPEIYVYDQFGNGITKIQTPFEPDKINISGGMIIVNNSEKIIFDNLKDTVNGIPQFSNVLIHYDSTVISSMIFKKRLYILYKNYIGIYNIL